jgi:hypothetical protein
MGTLARRRIGAVFLDHPAGDVSPPQTASPALPSLPVTGGRRGEYAIGDLARELRLTHYRERRRIIDALRALARHKGMPLPRTPRVHAGKVVDGPGSIHLHSRWDAGEIDAWLDGRTTPGGAGALRIELPPPLRAEMARRAQEIAA